MFEHVGVKDSCPATCLMRYTVCTWGCHRNAMERRTFMLELLSLCRISGMDVQGRHTSLPTDGDPGGYWI